MDATERKTLEVACRLLGKSLVSELRKIEDLHRIAFQQAQSAYKNLRSEAIHKATAEIDATLVDEKSEVDTLQMAYRAASLDLEVARVAESKKFGCKRGDEVLPVGTKMQRTLRKGYYDEKTEYGVIEVCTRETVFPENIGKYNTPTIGSFFVRIMKKDGTPGRRIVESFYNWEVAKQ